MSSFQRFWERNDNKEEERGTGEKEGKEKGQGKMRKKGE
jgi:hypothetical protein